MKKISSIFILICLVIFTLHAQTFVSTTPSNKNVIFEEFTGKNCGYCPVLYNAVYTIRTCRK